MYVLALEPGKSFEIGDGMRVFVLSVQHRKVRMRITAPSAVRIYPQEIVIALNEAARRALAPDDPSAHEL